MSSLLLLNFDIVFSSQLLILSDTLLLKYFSLYGYFEGNLDSVSKFNNMAWMTSNYVIVLIKLRLNVGNDKYIILCNISGLIMNGFEFIEG